VASLGIFNHDALRVAVDEPIQIVRVVRMDLALDSVVVTVHGADLPCRTRWLDSVLRHRAHNIRSFFAATDPAGVPRSIVEGALPRPVPDLRWNPSGVVPRSTRETV
jgi:hypothetical protein